MREPEPEPDNVAQRAARRTAWLAENKDAIERYNTRIARDGLFSDRWRRF